MIVAGEASGDAHAAALVDALSAIAPETQFECFGATGRQMRAAGVDSVVRADELSILGLWEIARDLPKPKDRKFIRANHRIHARRAHLPSRRPKTFELSLRRDRAQRVDKRSGMRITRGFTGDDHYAKTLG